MISWWNKNIESQIENFRSWTGNFDYPSRKYCRDYIVSQNYKSIIDCGCGLAIDYYGFKNDQVEMDYTGLDSCKHFVELNKQSGIVMIEAELEGDINLPNSSYDCLYCREVIEHLSCYEKTISEFIRIAKKEVIIVFFIPFNLEDQDQINYWECENLYHNKYNKIKLENFISSFDKVERLFWHEVDDPKSTSSDPSEEIVCDRKYILHIILK